MNSANLNETYFGNRIDRYILFKNSANLTEYLIGITNYLKKLYSDLDGKESHYRTKSCSEKFYTPQKSDNFDFNDPNYIYIYPCVQMGKHGIDQDLKFSQAIFSKLPSIVEKTSTSILCTSYLNLTKWFRKIILKTKTNWKILTSSPVSNSFYNSNGFSSYIPKLYQYNLYSFFRDSKLMHDNIQAYEFNSKDKTFHAKGI